VSYLPVQSRFGTLWVHRCPPLDDGPEWARVERLVVDSDPRESYIVVDGNKLHFHLHLFLEADGKFHVSDRDKTKCPADICAELESLINSNFAADDKNARAGITRAIECE
jgi:hypothetical protein